MNKKAAGILSIVILFIAVLGISVYVKYVGISLPDFLRLTAQSSTKTSKKTAAKKQETVQDVINQNQKPLSKNFLRVVELQGSYDTSKDIETTVKIEGLTQNRDAVALRVLSIESQDKLSRALSRQIKGLSILATSLQKSEYKKGEVISLKLRVYSRPQNLYGFRIAEE